eukprot:TRINITY_DN4643_c0_g1_i2.p1 TRINITY_DN4643_c0_g1~~TRINITY_DN4643_c0_g1_i2.p1  ORF type:complete len:380 (-),score=9.06 TRINITY_DN4643_c0_g1_i2:25-1164(-)
MSFNLKELLSENNRLRMKYPDCPAMFLKSEEDLFNAVLLIDEVSLGKSRQAISVFKQLLCHENFDILQATLRLLNSSWNQFDVPDKKKIQNEIVLILIDKLLKKEYEELGVLCQSLTFLVELGNPHLSVLFSHVLRFLAEAISKNVNCEHVSEYIFLELAFNDSIICKRDTLNNLLSIISLSINNRCKTVARNLIKILILFLKESSIVRDFVDLNGVSLFCILLQDSKKLQIEKNILDALSLLSFSKEFVNDFLQSGKVNLLLSFHKKYTHDLLPSLLNILCLSSSPNKLQLTAGFICHNYYFFDIFFENMLKSQGSFDLEYYYFSIFACICATSQILKKRFQLQSILNQYYPPLNLMDVADNEFLQVAVTSLFQLWNL